jgi:Leucine-rich repeat (LRR) protein
LINIRIISLAGNHFEVIDENLFENNKNLENIWLNDNKIKAISSEMFNNMTSLEDVDFRNNTCHSDIYRKERIDEMKKTSKEKCAMENESSVERELRQRLQATEMTNEELVRQQQEQIEEKSKQQREH